MDKKLERNIIWSLAMILIVLGLTSCASAPLKVMSKPIEEKILLTDTIGNMPKIVDALTCMFAPNSPTCDKELKDKPVSALTDGDY
tara:strand:+ start:549 stop:806 length:258 start_codon:yes stop_codon:yes gene_type:complete